MNEEGAKVPNVEADWSIEIFLFSNGQHFSPPRKYLLFADKLNVWQATLSYLAQAHYGVQCPLISLYTIDGKLVEGPLELKDGQAYVAVVASDKYVDAGYQKYLIRASRSWEKRQARKKLAGCLPNDRCCLCPEKERCCDLQACCECSEDSQFSLLSATGHPELRPAGGHYMSSRPIKPASTDYNGPKSGKIGPTTGEHEVRPAEYGHLPVSAPDKPDKYVAGLSEYGANTAELAPKLSENRTISGDYRAGLVESRTKLDSNTVTLGEYKNGSKLSQNGERPAIVNKNESRLSKDVVKPVAYGSRLDQNVPRPADYTTRAIRNVVKPDEYGDRPGAYESKPIRNAPPDTHEANQDGRKDEMTVNKAKTREYETKPNWNDAKPDEHGAKPDEYKTRPLLNRAKPGVFVPRPGQYEPKSNANEVMPSEHGVTPSEHETKPDESKTKLTGNGIKLGEHETSSTINKAKPVDSGARPAKNEVRPTEDVVRPTGYSSRAEVEHTRRISRQRAALIQQTGKVSGQKAREKEARLSEQRSKQSDHLPRLGGRESKLGDHEAKSGGQGLRTIDHDTKLGNPAARVTEPSARMVTPVPRPCYKDIINSRIRTSDLGQPKSKTPTKLDETARLDVTGVKNTVVVPGARPSSAGGTAGAGASYISEAQQHARRGSLFAGKQSTEKKRLSNAQNSPLIKKPAPIPSELRELEDKQPIKTNKEIVTKKINEKASVIPVPASNAIVKSETLPDCTPKVRTPSALLLPTISVTNLEPPTINKAPLENIIDETDLLVVSTHSFDVKHPESDITASMRLDSVKQVVDTIQNSPEETQTEIIYVRRSTASLSMNVEVQTDPETNDKKQNAQEESLCNKAKFDSDICCMCSQRGHKLTTVDADENTIPIAHQGEGGTINLKLDIMIRNIVKSVYCCQKNCQRARSLTTIMTSEKESQISVEDNFSIHCDSLHSLLHKTCSRGYGFECSPKVLVVQCAGCGRLNKPPVCDAPQCCENNKKYFVLLTNSMNEGLDECCNFYTPCCPGDLKQSQLKNQSGNIPVTTSYSNMTLDTITTVTVSGVPLQTRDMKNCCIKNCSCQTEESHDCMINKRKVSITEESVATGEIKKKCNSSGSQVITQGISPMAKRSCSKICEEILAELKEQKDSPVCTQADQPSQKIPTAISQTDPEPSQKVLSAISQTDPVPSQKVPLAISQTDPVPSQKVPLAISQTDPVPSQKVPLAISQTDPVPSQKVPLAISQTDPVPSQKVPLAISQTDPVPSQKVPLAISQTDPVPSQKVPLAISQTDPVPSQKVPLAISQTDPVPSQKVPLAISQTDPVPSQKVPLAISQTDPVPSQKVPLAISQTDPVPSQKVPLAISQTDPVPSQKVPLAISQTDPVPSQKVPSAISQTDPVPSQKVPLAISQTDPVPSQKVPLAISQTDPIPTQKVPSAISQTDPVPSQKIRPACSRFDPVPCQKVPPACSRFDPVPCQKVPSACSRFDPVPCQKVPPACSRFDPVPCQMVPSACSRFDPVPCQKVPPACSRFDPVPCQKVLSACSRFDPVPCQMVPPACARFDPVPCQKVPSACSRFDPVPCQKVPPACSRTDPVPCQKVPPACSRFDPVTCQKVPPACSRTDPEPCQKVPSACSRNDPVPCQNVASECSKVSSHTCPKVLLMGCQQTCPPAQILGCSPVSSTFQFCSPRCPVPVPYIQIQTQVCPCAPQVSNMTTQTQWRSLILQARLHCDGRYSFHLPSLNALHSFPF